MDFLLLLILTFAVVQLHSSYTTSIRYTLRFNLEPRKESESLFILTKTIAEVLIFFGTFLVSRQERYTNYLVVPVKIYESLASRTTSSRVIFSSLAMISCTLGPQNPPWHLPIPGLHLFFTPSTVVAPTFL